MGADTSEFERLFYARVQAQAGSHHSIYDLVHELVRTLAVIQDERAKADDCHECGYKQAVEQFGHPLLKAAIDAWRESFEILARGKDGSKR